MLDPQLALRFQAAVERAVYSASRQPFAMQVLNFEVRRWPVNEGFPHGILYRIEGNRIIVLSVFHPKRDPKAWKNRARS